MHFTPSIPPKNNYASRNPLQNLFPSLRASEWLDIRTYETTLIPSLSPAAHTATRPVATSRAAIRIRLLHCQWDLPQEIGPFLRRGTGHGCSGFASTFGRRSLQDSDCSGLHVFLCLLWMRRSGGFDVSRSRTLDVSRWTLRVDARGHHSLAGRTLHGSCFLVLIRPG